MSNFNKFKTNSECVGGRNYSGTNNIRGVVTAKRTKMLKGNCVNCKRKKSMTVSDATIAAEGLKDFFKSDGPYLLLDYWLLLIREAGCPIVV